MALSQTHQPTFLLLPTFDYDPTHSNLTLGTILGRTRHPSKLSPTSTSTSRRRPPPDPSRPFTSKKNVLQIDEEEMPVLKKVLRDFHVELSEKQGVGMHVFADLSFLSVVGGKVEWGLERVHGVEVDCRNGGKGEEVVEEGVEGRKGKGKEGNGGEGDESVVERITFEPTVEYISKAVEGNKLVREYVEADRWSFKGKSVFLVTGLMIVQDKAKVVITGSKKRDVEVEGKVDVTAATGGTVPLATGAGTNFNKENETKREFEVDGPFILAYRLRRVRVSRKGLVKSEEDFNELALMNGTITVDGDKLQLEQKEVTLTDLLADDDEAASEIDSDDED